MRQTSPACTCWLTSRLPPASVTSTVPSAGMVKVVGCDPYSSAFWAIRPTFGTEPMVAGSRAPLALCSSTTAWYMGP
ncbi:Uncharacterised protein [Mycobacteroides abscessus subsp. abscessus]|nr:Uncharacterised protein [Mycobacteroides abscessus subsp. abscessus]